MSTWRVGLVQPLGWTVSAKHNSNNVYSLIIGWQQLGYWDVIVTYKGREPHHTEEEKRIVPWHMVAWIDPVPYPSVTSDVTKGDVIYGRKGD